jgi:GNAT superfamily N-acetyltransferase
MDLGGGVQLREGLRPGDIGTITWLHGSIYHRENGYGLAFEAYVAEGLGEFYRQYDHKLDRVWICEKGEDMVASLVLMHRGEHVAQLRYFLVRPEYRGLGLGRKLMELFMACLREKAYRSAYLWTTNEQSAAAVLYKRHGFELAEEKYSEAFGKPLYEQRLLLHL